MKKLIAIVAVAVTGFASFGQGFFSFTGSTRGIWDAFANPASPKLAATMNVGFLFGTGSALISGIAASTPTNSVSGLPSSTAQAWTAITTDPNYTVAFNSGTGTEAVAANVGNGSWSYNGAGTFGVTGSAAGSVYNVIVFGWSSAYATAALAAAAGSPVGWSSPFSYTPVSSIGTASTMPAAGLLPFAVTTPVPEPATIALAGLGGLSLLALRRRNSK